MKPIFQFACCLTLLASAALADSKPLNLQTDVPIAGAPQTVIFVERDFDKGESSGLHIITASR